MKPVRKQPPGKDPRRVDYLVRSFMTGSLSSSEQDELDEWLLESQDHVNWFAEITDQDATLRKLEQLKVYDGEEAYTRFATASKPKLFWYAAAAMIVFLAGAFLLYWLYGEFIGEQSTVKMALRKGLPGIERAILKLDDGTELALSEDGIETANVFHPELKIYNGVLEYAGRVQNASVIHELQTPRGGSFSVKLPDGSKVTLNAGSTLTYPLAFAGNERKVELTGEAFFDIISNSEKPFRISLGKERIVEVKGTTFNLRYYPNEKNNSLTLIKGTVSVIENEKLRTVNPGQRCSLDSTEALPYATPTKQWIGWKEKEFRFQDADIREVMSELAKWYDIDVRYDYLPTDKFYATFPSSTPLEKALEYLAGTGEVKFRKEENTIVVIK